MTIQFPLVRIVSAPTPDAEVLYDFGDDKSPGLTSYVQHDGFSVGVPQLLGDPDALGVDWGLRQLKIPQVIHGPKIAALAAQSRLARVLMRQRYWVFMQLDATTAPVWWHGYRSQPGEVVFDAVYVDDDENFVPPHTDGAEPLPDTWQVAVQIDADPWGSLERITLPTVTVGNALGASAVALPDIAGEALASLRLGIGTVPTVGPGVTSDQPRWLLMTLRGDPVVRTYDIGTGDDATGVATDWQVGTSNPTEFSGGSYRSSTFPIGEPKLGPAFYPSLPSGRYKILARVVFVLASTEATFQAGLTPQTMTSVALPSAATAGTARIARVVELGETSTGVAGLPADVVTPSPDQPLVLSTAFAASTPGLEVRLDSLTFVRVDAGEDADADCLALSFNRGFYIAGDTVTTYVDGDTGVVWGETDTGSSAQIFNAHPTNLAGIYPRVDPARANTLVALPLASVFNAAMALGATHDIDLSLQPQVLWLGDGQQAAS